MLHRYRRRPGSFGRPSRSSFASIRIDGRNEELDLVVRRRVHVPQKVLDGKRPRMHYYRLRANFPKRLILVVHRGPLKTFYRIRETWIPRAASQSYWQWVAPARLTPPVSPASSPPAGTLRAPYRVPLSSAPTPRSCAPAPCPWPPSGSRCPSPARLPRTARATVGAPARHRRQSHIGRAHV